MQVIDTTTKTMEIAFHEGYYKPIYATDKPMFKHCADGMTGVTDKYLNETLVPVLNAHGYNVVKILP